jgi:hypothetical protein
MSSAKIAIYPNLITSSLIIEREEGGRISAFFEKKRKGEELTNCHGKTGSWWRWLRRRLDSPNGSMARV